MSAERLHPADIEAIAVRVAELVSSQAPSDGGLVDVRALATALGVSRDFVYSHAAELGGIKLGSGPRAGWRFDVAEARTHLASRGSSPSRGGREGTPVGALPRRGRRRDRPSSGRPLAIRGGGA